MMVATIFATYKKWSQRQLRPLLLSFFGLRHGTLVDSKKYNLCFENVAQVKRLVDKFNYSGPIIAMSDNTKLKEHLGYSSLLGCIVGSTFSSEVKVTNNTNINNVIDLIKQQNAI